MKCFDNYYIVKLILRKGKKESLRSFYMNGADFIQFLECVVNGSFGSFDFYEVHLREVK